MYDERDVYYITESDVNRLIIESKYNDENKEFRVYTHHRQKKQKFKYEFCL